MKLEQFKRLFFTDFEEKYHDLMETLSGILNDSLEKLHQLADHRISLKDNIYCELRSVDLTVDADGIPINPVQFTHKLDNRTEGIQLLGFENLTNPMLYPSAGVTVITSEQDRVVTIKKVTGLPINNKFRLKLILYG